MRYGILSFIALITTIFADFFIIAHSIEYHWSITRAVIVAFLVTLAGLAVVIWMHFLDEKHND